jgi:hypothetical protein
VGFCDCGDDARACTKENNMVAVRAVVKATRFDSDTKELSVRHQAGLLIINMIVFIPVS